MVINNVCISDASYRGELPMFRVNIYIESNVKGFRRQSGWYGAVIEFIRRNGEPETRDIFEKMEATGNNIMLTALLESLKILNKECDVTVFMDSDYVRKNIEQGTIRQWKMNGWKTAKNEPVANMQEWQQMEEQLQKHKLSFSYAKENKYRQWIQNEIRIRKDGCEKWEQQKLLQ